MFMYNLQMEKEANALKKYSPWNILPAELLDKLLSGNPAWCFPFAFLCS